MSLLKRLNAEPTPPPAAAPTPAATMPAAAAPAPALNTPPAAAAPALQTPAAAPSAGVEVANDSAGNAKMLELSLAITDRILASFGSQTQIERSAETERLIQERFANYYRQSGVNLGQDQIKALYAMVMTEIYGFGPIQNLLDDDTVTEVMVNGPQMIYAERKGKIVLTDIKFLGDDHALKIIDRIIRPLGRRVDRKWPMVDARLPDGSRVNAIIPPCAIDGPTITIRKFSKSKLQISDLIRFGSMTKEMADFLQACVVSKLNVVVSGGTGSGKTTLLNVLSNFIPEEDRIVTIEDSAELKLAQDHVVRLEAKPAEVDGTGRVAIRDLVINSLRMRPERIVIGECRGGEAFDMLQAMNTGHDGSLTTLHANAPRDAIARLETMCMMAGMDMPLQVIREQIASAINLIVQQTRLRDGSRKVSAITEVQGLESGTVVLQDIFVLEEKGITPEGKMITELRPTGVRPKFTPTLEANGFKLPPSIFGAVFPGRR
ncbi:MAG: CpaF family protein [Chloroflexi bacterium]|nr:CpaF family protein [Chloroflexota bacterium]